ncbi:MAG: DUF3794 domain-containing protein [Hespellia sp.]|nr:DUF3794 domain-containing protein [Hespellia sp.]
MELIKKTIHSNRIGKHSVDQFYLDEDVNVPDSKEDIMHMIQGEGYLKIDEVKPAQEYITVIGKLYYHILYAVTGEEAKLAVLEGKLPVEEVVYTEDDLGMQYVVRPTRIEFSPSLIHSRKINIRAMIELEIIREIQEEDETTIDVDSPVLFKKKRTVNLLELSTMKRDTYRIKEEIKLPGAKENIRNIMMSDVAGRRMDIRIGPDELLIRGELQLFVLYETENGNAQWLDQSISYEGSIECFGAEEGMYHHVYADLEDSVVEPRMDEDGEMRILGVESTLSLRIHIYCEEEVELLEDVYSLNDQCEIQTRKTIFEELLLKNQSRSKVSEQLILPELKEDVLQICHCSGMLQIDSQTVTADGIQIDGVIHGAFLYLKADDAMPYGAWQGMVPFTHLIEGSDTFPADLHFDIAPGIESLSVSLLGNGEVDIKASLVFDAFIRKPVPIEVITDVTLTPQSGVGREQGPGIVGYIVKDKDQLWDLAKKYQTTVEGIMEVNHLEKEEVKEGERLLIFKENVSII